MEACNVAGASRNARARELAGRRTRDTRDLPASVNTVGTEPGRWSDAIRVKGDSSSWLLYRFPRITYKIQKSSTSVMLVLWVEHVFCGFH